MSRIQSLAKHYLHVTRLPSVTRLSKPAAAFLATFRYINGPARARRTFILDNAKTRQPARGLSRPNRACSYFASSSFQRDNTSYARFLTASRSITSRNKYCATLIYTPSHRRAATKGWRGRKENSPHRLFGALNYRSRKLSVPTDMVRYVRYLYSRQIRYAKSVGSSVRARDALFATISGNLSADFTAS